MASERGNESRTEPREVTPPSTAAAEGLWLRRIVVVSAIALVLVGATNISYWTLGTPALEDIDPHFVPTGLLAGISYLVIAFPLVVCAFRPNNRALFWLAVAAAAVLLLLYILKGVYAATGAGFDIEESLAPHPGEHSGFPANRISPVAAVCIPAAALSLLMLLLVPSRYRRIKSSAIVVAIGVMSVGFVALLGYAYGTSLLYGSIVRPIAVSSSIAMAFLGLGAAAASGPRYWPVSAFIGNSVRAVMLSAFLPLTTAIVFVVGVITVRVIEVSRNPVLVASLVALVGALLIGVIVYRISSSLGGEMDRANATRRAAEKKLKTAHDKLTMLGSITRHDILNEVSVLQGWSSLAAEAKDEKERADALRRIKSATRSIEQLVTFAGVYQEVGIEAPGWIDVQRAFESGAAGVSRFRASVHTEVEGLSVFADRMLEKVFTNLIDNSQRHGEHVTKISLRYEKSDGGLKLIYEDDGVGIPESDKSRLFESGFGKHTGLGMYLSVEILAITGLKISETGTFGKGVRFEIQVPNGKYRFASQRTSQGRPAEKLASA